LKSFDASLEITLDHVKVDDRRNLMPPRELERGCLQAHFGGGFFCWVILAFGKKLGSLLQQFDVLAQPCDGGGRSERHRSLMQHKIRWRLPTTIRLAHGLAATVVMRTQDLRPRSLPTFRQLPCPCDPGAMNGPLLQFLLAKWDNTPPHTAQA
jgi:hypothetical protein